MATIPFALTELNSRRNELADNLVKMGVGASRTEQMTTLIPKVLDISSGGGEAPSDNGFTIDPLWNWYDLKAILADDDTPYQYRVAEAIYDSFPTSTITIGNGIVAVRTSDGSYYTDNATHTWDETQDRQLYKIQADGTVTESAKARYIIKYYDVENITLTIPYECFYFVIDRAMFENSGIGAYSTANAKRSLIYFDLMNGATLKKTTKSMNNMFNGCHSLKSVPLFNTENVTHMDSVFGNCYSLESIPLFNTENVTTMSQMFSYCYSLESIPLFNTAKVSDMNYMFSNCYSLEAMPLFNTAKVLNMSNMFRNCYSLKSVELFNTEETTDMTDMFNSCYSLESVDLFNTAKVTNMSNMFYSCYALKSVTLFNMENVQTSTGMFTSCFSLVSANLGRLRANLAISNAPNLLNRTSILYMIQNRNMNISGSITLTIGSTNLDKLTASDKALATANRIILA